MSRPIRPFLKWAGGKFRLVPQLQALLPHAPLYIEPFVGAGAVFLNMPHPRTHLNDINADVILLYETLKTEGDDFIQYAKRWFAPQYNTAPQYYRLREVFNRCRAPRKRAALFLYLNRHGYNGLVRYNLKGGFNVPFGAYKKPLFPEAMMRAFHMRLQSSILTQGDYGRVIENAPPGSVVYCDPPYVPLSTTASFTRYHTQGFTHLEQQRLAHLAKAAAKRGVHIIISNHDLPVTRQLYRGAKIKSLTMPRLISCQHTSRRPVKELLAYFPALAATASSAK